MYVLLTPVWDSPNQGVMKPARLTTSGLSGITHVHHVSHNLIACVPVDIAEKIESQRMLNFRLLRISVWEFYWLTDQSLRSGQVWGHTPEQRVAASTLRRYSFVLIWLSLWQTPGHIVQIGPLTQSRSIQAITRHGPAPRIPTSHIWCSWSEISPLTLGSVHYAFWYLFTRETAERISMWIIAGCNVTIVFLSRNPASD